MAEPKRARIQSGDHAAMAIRVREAVRSLDVENPDHWTADDTPMLGVVNEILGENLTRAALDGYAPITRAMLRQAEEREMDELMGLQGVPATPSPEAGALPPPPAEPEPESVLTLPLAQVLRSPALSRRARAEIDERLLALTKERARLDEEMAKLSRAGEYVDRALAQHGAEPGLTQHQQIQRVQQRAHIERWERSKAMRRITDAGVTASDFMAALDPRAPIDRAFQSKRKFGARRPSVPVPLGAGS